MIFGGKKSTAIQNETNTAELGQQTGENSFGLGLANSRENELNVSVLDGDAISEAFSFSEKVLGEFISGQSTAVGAVEASNASVLAAKNAETDNILKVVVTLGAVLAVVFIFGRR